MPKEKRRRHRCYAQRRSSLRAVAGALARVVSNLVMNAIRHTPADGAVVVAAHHGTVTVRNHHPGCRIVVTIPV